MQDSIDAIHAQHGTRLWTTCHCRHSVVCFMSTNRVVVTVIYQ